MSPDSLAFLVSDFDSSYESTLHRKYARADSRSAALRSRFALKKADLASKELEQRSSMKYDSLDQVAMRVVFAESFSELMLKSFLLLQGICVFRKGGNMQNLFLNGAVDLRCHKMRGCSEKTFIDF